MPKHENQEINDITGNMVAQRIANLKPANWGTLFNEQVVSDVKTLVLLVGLPRSGKTTWAKEQGFPVVNPDSIRLAIHGQRFVPVAEPLVWAVAKTMVRALFLAGHATVILDACNTTRKRRDEWKSNDWQTRFVQISTAESVCINRANEIGDTEIVPVIERMNRQYEALEADELAYERAGR